MMKTLIAFLTIAMPVLASADSRPAPASADKRFTGGTGQTVSHDCGAGGKVAIEISSSTITLTGACAKVELGGSQNTVTIASAIELVVGGTENRGTIDAVDSIVTLGNRNSLTYKRTVKAKTTKLTLLGKGNSAVAAK